MKKREGQEYTLVVRMGDNTALSSNRDKSSVRPFNFCRLPPFIEEFRKLRLLLMALSGDNANESGEKDLLLALAALRVVMCERLKTLESM